MSIAKEKNAEPSERFIEREFERATIDFGDLVPRPHCDVTTMSRRAGHGQQEHVKYYSCDRRKGGRSTHNGGCGLNPHTKVQRKPSDDRQGT